MNLLLDIFEKSRTTKEIIGIAKYSDEDNFWCGHVLSYTNEIVVIQHFTKYGIKDGIIVQSISDIRNVNFENEYTRAMQCVIDYSKELEKEHDLSINYEHDDWQFQIIKQLEGNLKIVSSVEINRSESYTGHILHVSETEFVMRNIGKNGEDFGQSIYKMEDITNFQVNDIDNRRRGLLYNWRKASM